MITLSLFADICNLTCEMIAMIAGIRQLNYVNNKFKLFIYYLIVVFAIEIPGNILKWAHHKVYLIYMPFLVFDNLFQLLIATYFSTYLRKKSIPIFLGLMFIFVYGYDLYSQQTLNTYLKEAFLTHLIMMLIVYLAILFEQVMTFPFEVSRSPVFWFAIGSLIFYGCNLGYFATYDILKQMIKSKQMTESQLSLISSSTNFSSAIRYLMFIHGFYLMSKSKTNFG